MARRFRINDDVMASLSRRGVVKREGQHLLFVKGSDKVESGTVMVKVFEPRIRVQWEEIDDPIQKAAIMTEVFNVDA